MSEAIQAPAPIPVPDASAPVTTEAPAVAADTGGVSPDLAAAIKAHSELWSDPQKTPTAAKEEAAQVATETAAPVVEEVPAIVEPVVPSAGPEPEKPRDEVASTVARYLRQERMAKAARVEAAKELEAIKAERAKFAPVAEAMALIESDPVTAARKLFGNRLTDTDIFVKLLNGEGEAPAQAELTPEQREAAVAKRAAELAQAAMKEEQAKAAKEAEEAAKVKQEASKAAYYEGVGKELETKATQYPFLASEGVELPEWDSALRGHHKATGKVPTFDMLAAHFEAKLEARARAGLAIIEKKTGAKLTQAAPAVPVKSGLPAAAPAKVDVRTVPAPVKGDDYEARRVARIRHLEAMERAAR